MKKGLLFVCAIIALSSCNKLPAAPIEKVIDFCGRGGITGAEIGIVEDNMIKFYFYNDRYNSWQNIPSLDFALPSNCKDVIEKVFGIKGFGIVTDDRIIFYELIDENIIPAGFQETENGIFILPQNNQGVFTLYNKIAVIAGNIVNLYWYDSGKNTWEEMPGQEFVLPPNYKDVFGYSDNQIGVVADNKIKFFWKRLNDVPWAEVTVEELNVPPDFKGAFMTYFDWLGISTKDKIQFYDPTKKVWEEVRELMFIR